LFAALSLGCILRVAAEPIQPNEIEVVDGDTIRTHGIPLVRLVGFYAPETWRWRNSDCRVTGAALRVPRYELP
jgi:hypothetical protein